MSADVFIHPRALVESSSIGSGTRIWAFAHVLEGAHIGERCQVGDHCFIEGDAKLGDEVTLKNGVSVWDKVTLEDHVFVGPNAVFTNDPFPRADRSLRTGRQGWKETVVRHHATIGANATILCGLELGEYSFVAAGALVARSTKPFELVVGVPARHAGWVCRCGAPLAEEGGRGNCDTCGRSCRIPDGGPPEFDEEDGEPLGHPHS